MIMANWLWWLIIALFLHNCCHQVNHRTVIIIYSHWLSLSHTDHPVSYLNVYLWCYCVLQKKLITLANRCTIHGNTRKERRKEHASERYKSVERSLSFVPFLLPLYRFGWIYFKRFRCPEWAALHTCGKRGHWRCILLFFLSTTIQHHQRQWELHCGCIRLHSVLQGWCSHALPAIVCLAMDMHII